MKKFLQTTTIITFGIIASSCTTTDSVISTPTSDLAEDTVFLTSDEIDKIIIGNTISGVAHYSSVGAVPFKMYFERGTTIYRDRSVVRSEVKTAFGTHRLLDDGQLCRTSRTRSNGKETCFRFSATGGGAYKLIGKNGATEISIAQGRAL